jgi:hypothetical protein
MTSIENQHGSVQERGYAGVLTGREPSEQQGLHDTIAKLRAFSVLLCMDVDLADDLVAVTLTRRTSWFKRARCRGCDKKRRAA